MRQLDEGFKAWKAGGFNFMKKKDFKYKISLCRKEFKEVKHWLRMIAKAVSDKVENSRILWMETQELSKIFSSILL